MPASEKINVTFLQYGGLTYRTLLRLATRLDKRKFNVNYMWCTPGMDRYSSFKHPYPTEEEKRSASRFLEENGVSSREFIVLERAAYDPHLPWIGTNFWEIFGGFKTDVVFTWRSGSREYPFCHIDKPVVEWNVFGWADPSVNLTRSLAISPHCQRDYLRRGGDESKSSVVYLPVDPPTSRETLRQELDIASDSLVLGMHQRREDGIFSPICLRAIKALSKAFPNVKVVFMGGSEKYQLLAKSLGLDAHFLPVNNEYERISRFLNTLDIFTHARRDGETLGAAIQEAMIHGLPVISHKAQWNAHVETIGSAGYVCSSVEEYSQRLLILATDLELRKSLSLAAKQRAEKLYAWGKVLPQVEMALLGATEDFKGTKSKWTPIPLSIYTSRRKFRCLATRLMTNSVVRLLTLTLGPKSVRVLFWLKVGLLNIRHRL